MPDKIDRLRRQRGWTQSAFEAAAGLPNSRLSKWLMGQGEPTAAQALKIARLFGVSVESLIDDAVETPTVDGLSADERLLLMAAGIVGHETALKRIMAAADVPIPSRQPHGGIAVAESADDPPDLEAEPGPSRTLSRRDVPMPRTRRKPSSKPPSGENRTKKGRPKGQGND